MADLLELPKAKKDLLRLEHEEIIEKYELSTGKILKAFEAEKNRRLRVAAIAGGDIIPGADQNSIEASKAMFKVSAEMYFEQWQADRLPREAFASKLNEIRDGVIAAVAEARKDIPSLRHDVDGGRYEYDEASIQGEIDLTDPGQWFKEVCKPAIEAALDEQIAECNQRARAAERDRLKQELHKQIEPAIQPNTEAHEPQKSNQVTPGNHAVAPPHASASGPADVSAGNPGRRRGRPANTELNAAIAEALKEVGPDWQDELERVAEVLDRNKTALTASRKWKEAGCATWTDVLDEDKAGMLKALQERDPVCGKFGKLN